MGTRTETIASPSFQRYKAGAKDEDALIRMVTVCGAAENQKELNAAATMYILDMSYERSDICLAMKIIEIERGWR